MQDKDEGGTAVGGNNLLPVMFTSPNVEVLYPSLVRATPGSVAFDLRAVLEHPHTLEPNETLLVDSGLKIDMSGYPGLWACILPRSGLGHKHGLVLGNLVGLIDNDYQGELKVSLWNRSDKPYTIERGERIAQLVLSFAFLPTFFKTQTFDQTTQRGDGGFGHSGRV